jgi:mRNA interferase HigB
VHVISKKRILEFTKIHPNSKTSLENWFKIVDSTDFKSFDEIRNVFPYADKVGKFTVFNIRGNNYRLIAAIHGYSGNMLPCIPGLSCHRG